MIGRGSHPLFAGVGIPNGTDTGGRGTPAFTSMFFKKSRPPAPKPLQFSLIRSNPRSSLPLLLLYAAGVVTFCTYHHAAMHLLAYL